MALTVAQSEGIDRLVPKIMRYETLCAEVSRWLEDLAVDIIMDVDADVRESFEFEAEMMIELNEPAWIAALGNISKSKFVGNYLFNGCFQLASQQTKERHRDLIKDKRRAEKRLQTLQRQLEAI